MAVLPRGSALKITVLTALAFGMLIASTAMSRVEGSGFGGETTTIARASALFELFVMAWFFRKTAPPLGRVLGFGCLCAAVYVALFCIQLFGLEPEVGSTGLAASQLTGLFCGLSEGSFIILLCFLFSVQAPAFGAMSVAAGCLVFDALTAIATVVPTGMIPFLKVVCMVGGVMLVFACLRSVSASDSVLPEGRLLAAGDDETVRTSRPMGRAQKAGFLSCVIVFPFLYGVAVQLVNASGLGTYNIAYQAVALAVVAVLLVYIVLGGGSLRSGGMLLLAAPVMFAAFATLAVLGEDGMFAIGMLSRVDYSVCQLVFIVVLARMAHSSIGETCYYTAFFYGTLKLAALLGREFASVFLPTPLVQGECVAVALAALGLTIACCMCVALSGRRPEAEAESVVGKVSDDASASLGRAEKARLFAEFYGLSAREAQILEGFSKGYNMASIGEEVGVSTSTVGTYMHRIYVKTGVDGKQGLAERFEAFPG